MPINFLSFLDLSAPLQPGNVDLATAQTNLQRLNDAIRNSGPDTILYGPPGDFYIATSAAANVIQLRQNRAVVCAAGCMIKRRTDEFDSGGVGVLEARGNCSWTGGSLVGKAKMRGVGGINYPIYPNGQVVRAVGDDVLLQDITIDGYSGIAVMVSGDRVRVVNPTIRNPQDLVPAGVDPNTEPKIVANGAGIRVKRGTGFRCYRGDITSGGDAAIQFSGDDDSANDPRGNIIADGLFQDVTVASQGGGRLMLVGSTSPAIRNVGFVGITGTVTGSGDCIRIQNRNPDLPKPATIKTISHVFFRDISVTNGNPSSYAASIENELTASAFTDHRKGDDIAVSDILFANLSITTTAASDIGFVAFAAGAKALRPIRDVT